MNAIIDKRNELLAKTVIKGLESRNMSGYYAKTREEALKTALSLIEEGSTVTMGGGMSVHEIGLVSALKKGDYHFIDRDAEKDKRAAMLAAYDADVYLASVRKNRLNVTMFLMNGYQLRGVITGYDSFTVVLNSDGRQQVIYKHAISTIVAERPVDLDSGSPGGGSRPRP